MSRYGNVKTSDLIYHPETKTLVGQAAQIEFFWPSNEINIESSYTVARFKLDKVIKDPTGKFIIGWEYVPVKHHIGIERVIFSFPEGAEPL